MAGIHVSGGGIFSGSGDLTADWFYAEYNTGGTGRVFLPDGTLTLTGERSNLAFAYQWQGSSDYLHHQSGTVKITYGGGTQVNTDGAAPVNATTGRKGQFYDLIVDQGSNPRATDPVLLVTRESSANYMGIENSLTIVSGTARIGDTDATNTTKIGHVYIGASGTFSAGDVSTVNNGGYNNWDSSGSISLQSVIFNGNNGVFVGNGGTVQVLGPYTGNDSDHFVWDNNSKGTVYHNNGTIQFGGVGLLAIGQTSENATYNNYRNNNRAADGTGQSSNGDGGYLYNMSVGFRDGDSPTRHLGVQAVSNILVGNDLTVLTSGGIDKSSYGSTISGSVTLQGDAYWGNYAAQGGTNAWGRLHMAEGSYFKAPTGTLVLNKVIGGYTMYNPEGTFVHNNGNVAIEFDNTDATQVRNQSDFYNYEQTLTAVAHRVNWRGNGSAPYDFTIANNATIKEGSFRPTAPTNTMVISGTLEVQSGGTYGYSAGDFEVSSSIGSIDIKSGGNMYASTDLTTVGASSIPAIFDNNGTFYHNSGTVALEYGAGGDSKITGSARTTFYKLNTGFSYMHAGFVVEDTWATTGDGGGATNFYKASQNWVLGTTSSTGYLVTNVGTGVKAGENTTISGASELYPAVVSGTKYDFHTKINTLNNVDFTDAQTSDDNATFVLSNVDFSSGLTTNDSTTQTVTFNSGTWVKFGGSFLPGNGTKEIVSGATVIFDGTGNYLQDNAATVYGRGSATLWWDSTGYYSPNGSFTSTGFRDVFWNSDSRINQDAVFRGSNLIVGKQFSSQNRAIGTGGSPPKIIIANGGTISSSTNVFHASTFSNRGGLFTSSSAFAFDGAASSGALINAGAGSSIDNIFDGGGTVEGWVKLDSGGGANVGRLVSKDDWFIYFREDSFNNIRLQYTFNGGGAEWYTENNSFTFDNKWHHVAVTYDNSNIANDPSIYLDGKLVPLGTIVRPTGTRVSEVGDVLYVGNNPTGIRTLDGPVGMIRMFSDIRTAEEIRTDMFNQKSDMVDDGALVLMYQFDEGQGTTVTDVSTNSNTGTITKGTSGWADGGNWTGNKLGSETSVVAGNLYIGKHQTRPALFSESYFDVNKRKLISGSKFASKAHLGTTEYFIATSGLGDYDWLSYQFLSAAPIGTHNDVKIVPPIAGLGGSRFTFDSEANNEQCNTLVNVAGSVVRILDNADFYTQSFDNAGTWFRGPSYHGTIHDDGSTPNEYNPIDIIDDIDSGFDAEDLID